MPGKRALPVGLPFALTLLWTISVVKADTPAPSSDGLPLPEGPTFVNSLGMNFVRIESGSFRMGFEGRRLPRELLAAKAHFPSGDFDERPAHNVSISQPFYLGKFEVTNADYEAFDPAHRKQRGKKGFSSDDDEAVVHVSWSDARAFCDWLSEKEGRPYRLPTEAEWEYACRAGTTTPFSTGVALPAGVVKGTSAFASFEPVGLHVASTRTNAWGLHGMHGNVEEWCHDGYGPYAPAAQVDPVGRASAVFRVARGGSHSTEAYYLRSANRMGSLPDDRQWLTGFRVVLGELPSTAPLPPAPLERYQREVHQQVPTDVATGPDPEKPYFVGPRVVVKVPPDGTGPIYRKHNHFMAVTECANGDLLAAWFNGMGERGRELCVAASRLRHGTDVWEPASRFWDAPDRNDHAHALWFDAEGGKGNGTIYHFNGLGARYRHLAVLLRTSGDHGVTWSEPRLIEPDHTSGRHTVVESVFRAQNGNLVLPLDGRGGSVLLLSPDDGLTWFDPGGDIRGTHAGVTQLTDGRLLALARHGAIEGKLPKSISTDMGATWTSVAGPFNSIHTGKRLALMRLHDGALFCASFAREGSVTDAAGREHTINGLFGALSLDDGETWPHVRLLVPDNGRRQEIETMGGGRIQVDGAQGEVLGYCSVCQSADGVIHVVSSHNHYAFNQKWLQTPAPAPPPPLAAPSVRGLPRRAVLPVVYKPRGLPSQHPWRWTLSGRGFSEADVFRLGSDGRLQLRTPEGIAFYTRSDAPDGFGAVDPDSGFSAEIRTRVLTRKSDQHAIVFGVFDGGAHRYAISITEAAVFGYQGSGTKSGLLPLSDFIPLARDLDNTADFHTYRLAVRGDRVVQVYRDGQLLGIHRARYRSPRFGYVLLGAGPGAAVDIEHVAYDLDGPYAPP